jgi:hypothetical protein
VFEPGLDHLFAAAKIGCSDDRCESDSTTLTASGPIVPDLVSNSTLSPPDSVSRRSPAMDVR